VTLAEERAWQLFRVIAREARIFAERVWKGVEAVGRPRNARYGLPPDVHVVRAKGREYFYFQKNRREKDEGPRVKLAGRPYGDDGTPDAEWWARYRSLAGIEADENKAAGTFAALIAAYKVSPEWTALSKRTIVEWTRHLAYVEEKWGTLRVAATEPRHVLALRDSFADIPPADASKHTKPLEDYENRPAAANNLLRALSSMMTWSAPRGWIAANPCIGVKKLKGGKPYEPWSWEAICLFEKEARAALWHGAALALYTGQRYGDVIKMRWSDIREGQIQVEQDKTEKKLWIPMHKALKRVLKDVRRTSEFILTSERGVAWTENGFHTAWQREMKEEKFEPLREQKCVFHGLRKSAVVMLLEAGCTDAEVSAITGQSREMVEHYALQVNQKKLAASAILKWEALHRRERAREKRSRRHGARAQLEPA
jgi:integrase